MTEIATLSVRGDLHGHTTWSDGRESILAMALAAIERGYDYWACTDHSPRLTIAHGLSPARLREQLAEIAALNEQLAEIDERDTSTGRAHPFRVLTGMEVDIFEDGSLDADDAILAGLDIVVASCHRAFDQPPAEMTARLLAAARHPDVDVIGHISNRKLWAKGHGRARPESQFDHGAVFAACRAHNTAIELNAQAQRMDPPRPWVTEAAEAGCLFTLSTDAHNIAELDRIHHSVRRAEQAGVEPDRVLNTWELPRLLGHLGR